jgi:hypothetical protein
MRDKHVHETYDITEDFDWVRDRPADIRDTFRSTNSPSADLLGVAGFSRRPRRLPLERRLGACRCPPRDVAASCLRVEHEVNPGPKA